MNTLKETSILMDTYDDGEHHSRQQIVEKNILLLRKLDKAMENLSPKSRQEVIFAAVAIFFQQEK